MAFTGPHSKEKVGSGEGELGGWIPGIWCTFFKSLRFGKVCVDVCQLRRRGLHFGSSSGFRGTFSINDSWLVAHGTWLVVYGHDMAVASQDHGVAVASGA